VGIYTTASLCLDSSFPLCAFVCVCVCVHLAHLLQSFGRDFVFSQPFLLSFFFLLLSFSFTSGSIKLSFNCCSVCCLFFVVCACVVVLGTQRLLSFGLCNDVHRKRQKAARRVAAAPFSDKRMGVSLRTPAASDVTINAVPHRVPASLPPRRSMHLLSHAPTAQRRCHCFPMCCQKTRKASARHARCRASRRCVTSPVSTPSAQASSLYPLIAASFISSAAASTQRRRHPVLYPLLSTPVTPRPPPPPAKQTETPPSPTHISAGARHAVCRTRRRAFRP
jgi:hypothetical protein